MLRRMSSGMDSLTRGTRPKRQVSAPYFWDFGVYDRIFGTPTDNVTTDPSQVSNDQNSLAAAQENNNSSDVTTSSTSVKKAAWQSTLKDEDLVPYTVSFGETFESIALKHDMTAVELRRANAGVPFSTRPVPGQTLRVKKQSQTSVSPSLETNQESTRRDASADGHHHRTADQQQKHEGVERQVHLYVGPDTQIAGRLIVGVTSGFILFEPFAETNQDVLVEKSDHVKMIFALDRRDILGCAAVSKISARVKSEEQDEESSMLLQLVWKNAELGFPTEQQVFFEVKTEDTAVLVDAVYTWDLGDNHEKADGRRSGKSLTSGVAALRILEEHAKTMNMEDFINGHSSDDFDVKSDDAAEVVCEVAMIPRESTLLSREQATSLASALPQRLRAGCWEMVYDFVDHGVSMHALLSAAKQHPETLLLVQDLDTRDVIGVFTVCAWDPANHSNGFFGTGETFVFRFQGDSINLEKFEWSGTNEFFQTCSDHHIAVGGGGNFALCLDADLLHCTSGNCMTFKGLETRPLSSSPSFRINGIELWAIKAIHKGRSSTLGSLSDDKLRSPRVLKNKLSEDRSSTNNSGAVDVSALKGFNKKNGSDDDDYVKL